MRRYVKRTVGVLLVLVFAAAAGAYVYLRRSLPQIGGTVSVRGMSAPVEIVRDADNIPHIYAATRLDALYGLGYAHAQDRLWQMEFQRRIGHGRLSEILGAVTIPQDRFLRTVGFGRAAVSAWERLPADARAAIDAYVAGVNAFIATHRGSRLPPEFTLLRFEPEPWRGPDVMVWVKMMAWDLSANYSFELMRHDLERTVGAPRMKQLLPPYPHHGLSILAGPATDATDREAPREGAGPQLTGELSRSAVHAFRAALAAGHPGVREFLLSGARIEALGSNNWVVGPRRSATGKPLLANDPHLGTHVPSLWYLAHLSAPDFDVIGATLPGGPAVAIGRNRFIAWGETNVAADVQDLYRERLDAAGTAAEFAGAFEPLTMLSERIVVNGGEAIDIQVRVSRHGPLISDAINANNAASAAAGAEPVPPLEPMAFRWTALDPDDTTVVAFLDLNRARNWDEFTRALRSFVVPAQNFVYADVDGHIGYYAPGRVPIRAAGDGSRPAEGWTGAMEWTGWVPFDELPHVYDPPDDVIVTANHRPGGPGYRHFIALEFPEPYRAERILERLGEKASLTVEDMRDIQADTFSRHARTLLPVLLRHVRPSAEREQRAVERLRAWNYEASGTSAEAAIFQAWFFELAGALVGDELGPQVLRAYEGRFTYITRFVLATLDHDSSGWCNDTRTPETENCAQTITGALSAGLDRMSATLGENLDGWRWGSAHTAFFPHQGLETVPLLGWLLNRSVSGTGDWSTVNVGAVDVQHPYEQRAVPGYRQIVDLSPANDSRFLDAVGQSGHPLSPHYDDFLDDWRDVRHRRMRMERADVDRDALGTLRLVPASAEH